MMMKYVLPFALAGLGTLASTANATTSYCGYSSEATDVLYTGAATINGHSVPDFREMAWTGGMGTGGEVYRGNHRYCGEFIFYLYTGTSTNTNHWVTIDSDLNEAIVEHDVAQTKCVATLSNVEPIYAGSIGVTAGNWWHKSPGYDGSSNAMVFIDYGGYDDGGSPARHHVIVTLSYTGYLDENSVYGVNVICPTNIPNGP